MHKVCDIRNPELRAGRPPREMWASYVRDLGRLVDRALEGGAPAAVNSAAAMGSAALREAKKAA